jgi:hypothetical protein
MKEIRYERPNGKVVKLPKGYNVNELTSQMKSGDVKVSFVGEQIIVSIPGIYE